jgi:hypothetical protein
MDGRAGAVNNAHILAARHGMDEQASIEENAHILAARQLNKLVKTSSPDVTSTSCIIDLHNRCSRRQA